LDFHLLTSTLTMYLYNKFIIFKNKSLMFDNWINSDLIYINDILNENGEISQNLIIDKLKYKNNWMSVDFPFVRLFGVR
jgi:hypothetical protein